MKHYIKTTFDWIAGIASILGLVVSWCVSQTTKEIVREVEHYHETVVEHPPITEIRYLHDTVYVKVPEPVTIERKETVYFPMIYNSNTGNTTILSKKEIDSIRKHREDFLEEMERMKACRAE